MNHFLFNLARYLADRGFEIELFLLDEYAHFKPNADTYTMDARILVTQTNWANHYFFDPELVDIIKKDIGSHSFFIGCDWAPAFLNLVGKKLNIMVPYGSDIFYYPYFKLSEFFKINNIKFFAKNLQVPPVVQKAKLQKTGIEHADLFILDYLNPFYERVFKNLKTNERLFSTVPMIYPDAASELLEKSVFFKEILKRKQEGKSILYMNSRHSWTSKRFEHDYKANDLVFKALKKLKETGFENFTLITHEYGKDVLQSKKMIEELGLTSYVTWLPLMYRKDIRILLPLIDIGIGEFGYSFYSYGSVLEMIANKIPVVFNYKSSFNNSSYFCGHASFHATTETEIFKAVEFIIANPSYAKASAEFSFQWYKTEVAEKVCKAIERVYLQSTANNVIQN